MKVKKTEEKYMKIALKEAKKACKQREVPVGAVIVENSKIISKAHNCVEKKYSVIYHAEIIAIIKAGKKKKNWRLDNCILYTTMEPCEMCMRVIKKSRIKKIVYGIKNNENLTQDKREKIEIIDNVCHDECKQIIKCFFKKLR